MWLTPAEHRDRGGPIPRRPEHAGAGELHRAVAESVHSAVAEGEGASLRRPRIAGEKNSMTFEVQNLCQNKRSCSPPASDNRGKIEFKSAHAREIAGDFTRRAPCNRS